MWVWLTLFFQISKKMASPVAVFGLSLLLLVCSVQSKAPVIPDEDWGFVDVRTSAHMFWWLYGCTDSTKNREQVPLVLWLQVRTSVVVQSFTIKICLRTECNLHYIAIGTYIIVIGEFSMSLHVAAITRLVCSFL